MFDQTKLQPVKDLVKEAKSIAILLPPEPNTDLVGAALGLHLSFQQAGKFSQVGCSSPIKVENAELFGVDQIRETIGNQNLLISFDFKEENLKKVDYDVDENGQFTLLIQPQPGTPPPDANSVNFSYSGASADLVFVLGVNSLEELGKIYADEKQFLDSAQTVGLNANHRPSAFAKYDLSSPEASCVAEIAALLLKEFEIEPTNDAATNLLTTIYAETKQFTSNKANADTFEVVSYLMRHGGNLPFSSPFNTSSRFGAFPPSGPSPFGASPFGAPPLRSNPFGAPAPMPPMFDDEFPPNPPAPTVVNPAPVVNRPNRGQSQNVPNNWKKPGKVFRSGNNPRPHGQNNRQNGGQNGHGPQGLTPGSSL